MPQETVGLTNMTDDIYIYPYVIHIDQNHVHEKSFAARKCSVQHCPPDLDITKLAKSVGIQCQLHLCQAETNWSMVAHSQVQANCFGVHSYQN